jgi:hypothetical protein
MAALSRGGKDEEENLALACFRCNRAKATQQYGPFKAFAKKAFWVPDPEWRASETGIDRLMALYIHATDPGGSKYDQSDFLQASLALVPAMAAEIRMLRAGAGK